MIDLFSSEKLKQYYPKYKDFINTEIIAHEAELLSGEFIDHESGLLKGIRAKAKSADLWAPHLPENEGGLGLNLVEFAQISEIMAMTPFGHYVFNCQAPDIGNMELMAKYASEDLKAKYLKPLHHGEIRSCFSMTLSLIHI